jgi:hypothetical protein
VQALEHDSHIIPCTFDQVYFYKLGITLAKNENKSSIIYLGIGNMEGIRLLDEDNLQIYILSTRTFISSNEHELKKLRKVSYFTIQLDTDISTLDHDNAKYGRKLIGNLDLYRKGRYSVQQLDALC